ncbi:CapA family protein [Halobacillus halophilus]|uniref:CapA family protein n=1 Tax=Halobacillus halophilus TaxID=1570 RepID=UPI00136F8B41|nr:CapA family protein [Halobacillus halophilus]MYL29703.1 CapA family protein [Halobacillus halophilus]
MRMIMTGDSFIARRIPDKDARAAELRQWMADADVRFTNLEITTHKKEGYPSPVSGGTWAMASPSVLDDLKDYGFNLYNWANNHTMDYLYGGLKRTEEELDAREMVHAGAGRSLASASEPRYIETEKGRAALIGATSTFQDFWRAGDGNAYIPGRPGVNTLRHEEMIHISKEEMETLVSISNRTHLDAAKELDIKEGFLPPDPAGRFTFAGRTFKEGNRAFIERSPHPADMERLIRTVKEAERQADYVIVSLHSHEMDGVDKNKPADFIKEAARNLIDAGAHCIVGHGPHVVRGIEIYQGKPIFYSLGNFIFQNDSVTHLPRDFFEKYRMDADSSAADGFDKRSAGGTKGLGVNPFVWESVMAGMSWEGGRLTGIELQPIDLGFDEPRYRKGWPELSRNEEVLQRIQRLSREFHTEIMIENGKGYVQL